MYKSLKVIKFVLKPRKPLGLLHSNMMNANPFTFIVLFPFPFNPHSYREEISNALERKVKPNEDMKDVRSKLKTDNIS